MPHQHWTILIQSSDLEYIGDPIHHTSYKYEYMQLLKFAESKYKSNAGEIFGRYRCILILNRGSRHEKSNLYSKLLGYIATGRVNIRIHRDVTGEMWFGVG